MTTQQCLQILVHDIATKQEARMAQYQAEQPDDPADAGFVGKIDDEAGKVHLCLHAGRRFEAHLEGLWAIFRPDRGEVPHHGGIGAHIAHFADFPRQPRGREIGKGRHPLAQKVQIGQQLAWPTHLAGTVDRGFNAPLNIFADRLGITASASGNSGYRHALPM